MQCRVCVGVVGREINSAASSQERRAYEWRCSTTPRGRAAVVVALCPAQAGMAKYKVSGATVVVVVVVVRFCLIAAVDMRGRRRRCWKECAVHSVRARPIR